MEIESQSPQESVSQVAESAPAPAAADGSDNHDYGNQTPAAEPKEAATEKKPEPPKSLAQKLADKAKELADRDSKNLKPKEAPVAPAKEAPAGESGKSPDPVTGEPTAAAKYEPNLKFKVMDKEHDLPDFLKPALTDAKTEAAIKDIYTKALGLDIVKPRFQAERQKNQELSGRVDVYAGKVEAMRKHYARKDFGKLLGELSIPEEEVLQYFAEKANYMELPEDQRRIIDARKAAEERAYAAEESAASSKGNADSAIAQAKRTAIQVALARPDVQSFQTAFDSQEGRKPGDFWNTVCDEGDYAWYKSGQKVDLSPEQAIEAVMSRFKGLGQAQQAPATAQPVTPAAATAPAQTAPAAPQAQPAQVKPQPTVLPNVAGKAASSPAKSKPRSIAELKKIAASFN